jgi:predicted nucleotide-binding protein (sugar kinase/HSP70/actin superfamily)
MVKKAMVAAGFEQVPVATLSTSTSVLNDQPGFKLSKKEFLYKAVIGMMFHDALSDMFHSTVIREKHKGQAQSVVDRYLRAFMDGTIEVSIGSLLRWLRNAVTDFNAIETLPGEHPRVGIVGEIYVKYNAFSNNHAANWLMGQGLEVVMPGFFEFFEAGMVSNGHAARTHVKNRDLTWLVNTLGQKVTGALLHQFDGVMQSFARYRAHSSIQEVAGMAKDILSLNHQYGEGWLIVLKPEDWDGVKPSLVPGAQVAGPYEAKMAADGFAGCA